MSLLAATAMPALAQSGPYYLALGQSVGHESNLFRLPEGAPLASSASRGDTVSITTLAAGVDQTISRQRLRADATWRASRFAHNDSLNNQGHGLKLAWDWATAERVSGSVAAQLDRSLVRFDNGRVEPSFERNIALTRNIDATARIGVVTRWSAELGYSHAESNYSASAFDSREYRQDSYFIAARYSPGSALSGSLGLRAVRGHYPRFAKASDGSFVADHYDGRHVDLGLRYSASAVHQFEGRVSLGNTRYERATSSDLSGLTGLLVWNWRPSGKLRLESRLSRERGQDTSSLGVFINSSGGLSNGRVADFSRSSTVLGSNLVYELTAKLNLTAGLQLANRDLRDTRQDIFGQFNSRSGSDRGRAISLGARWQATRGIVVGCELVNEQRTASNELSSDLSSHSRTCWGQVSIP